MAHFEIGLWKDTNRPAYGCYYRFYAGDILIFEKFNHFYELDEARAWCNAAFAVADKCGYNVVVKGLTKDVRAKKNSHKA